MEFVFEKIRASSTDKNGLINIYSVGKKVHEAILCDQNPCGCAVYLEQTNLLIENMNERQTLTDEEKVAFLNLCKEYKNSFLLFDQICRKHSAEIYQLERTLFLTAIFFEVEKIKTFLNLHEKIQKLDGKLYVIEKSFV